MQNHSYSQQTLDDFFTLSRAQRVWLAILAALTSLMILGAAYEFAKPKPEPQRMTRETSDDTFAYLDVLLLSDWGYNVTGEENHTFYEAMDPDGNWFLLSLDQNTYGSLGAHGNAYHAYLAENNQRVEFPEPTRLTGMPSYLYFDDAIALASYYGVSFQEFEAFFGSYYFNEGASNAMAGAILYIIGGVIFVLFLLAIVLQLSFVRRNKIKSENRLYSLGLLDDAETQLTEPETVRYDKMRLALSRDFAFVGTSGHILPYADIGWLYPRTQRSRGIVVATQLMAGTVYGKTVYLAARFASNEFIAAVAQKVLAKNPDCLVGYTFEQSKIYGERVRDYKANNPR